MAKKKREIKLGNKVRDIVTGFTGIATAKLEFLNGCVQYAITGKASAEDQVRVVEVDAEQVVYVGVGVRHEIYPDEKAKKKRTGGPSSYRAGSRLL